MSIHQANQGRRIITLTTDRKMRYDRDGGLTDWQEGLEGVVTSVESHGSNPWTRYSVRFDEGGGAAGLVDGIHFEFTTGPGSCHTCTATSDELVRTPTRLYGPVELCPTCRAKFPKIVA